MRYVVIDIEASGFDGFPIEVGWCDQDGNSESHFIRPAWNWTGWDIRAERVHGINHEYLATRGEPHEAVDKLIADMLARCRRKGVIVASDNPDYDCEWLVKLLQRADIEASVRLASNAEHYAIAMEPMFAALAPDCLLGFCMRFCNDFVEYSLICHKRAERLFQRCEKFAPIFRFPGSCQKSGIKPDRPEEH